MSWFESLIGINVPYYEIESVDFFFFKYEGP